MQINSKDNKPKKIFDKIIEYIMDIWVKVVAQAFMTILFYIVYKIIGKKGRANDRISKAIEVLFSLAPTKEDTFFQSIKKSNETYRTLAVPKLGTAEQVINNFFENLVTMQQDQATKTKQFSLHKDKYFVSVLVNSMIKRKYYKDFKTVEASASRDNYFNYEIYELSFDKEEKLYVMRELFPWGTEFSSLYITNFDHKKKIQEFLKSIGQFVFVDYLPQERTFTLSSVKHENAVGETEKNPFLLHPKIEEVLDQEFSLRNKSNIQRSVLLLGPPGRGKTGGVYEYARRRNKTLLKFDASIIELASSDIISELFQYSETDIILLDEIDRIIVGNQDEKISRFLYSLEAFKAYSGNPVVVATANTLKNVTDAALRPGRLESLIVLEKPTPEEQKTFCREYAKSIGYEFPSLELEEEFLKATVGFTEAFLKDWIIQLKTGTSIATVANQISLRKRVVIPTEAEK